MLLEYLFRWNDPHTWPGPVYVWLALMLAGWIKPLWRWTQRQRASGWPTAMGLIQSATINKAKPFLPSATSRGKSTVYVAELAYSYSVGGEPNSSSYKREFGTEQEAWEFTRDLKGKPVAVQYNPNNPSKSTLSESSIETLLQTRPPQPAEDYTATSDSIPRWLKMALWPIIALSAVGLMLSLWVHFGAVLGRRVAPAAFFWILHIGIFVVWLPAVLVARNRVGTLNSRDFWKVVLKGSPDWMRYMVYGFFGYAIINFALFMLKAPTGDGGANPPAVVWRGFSGHWMAFYSAALAILYSAATSNSTVERCLNGHTIPPNTIFCARCGQPAMHS